MCGETYLGCLSLLEHHKHNSLFSSGPLCFDDPGQNLIKGKNWRPLQFVGVWTAWKQYRRSNWTWTPITGMSVTSSRTNSIHFHRIHIIIDVILTPESSSEYHQLIQKALATVIASKCRI